MKKILTILMVAVLLTGCSSSSNDRKLLDQYYTMQFALPCKMDDFSLVEYTSKSVGSSNIPGLKNSYVVDFSYSFPSVIKTSMSSGWGGELIKLTVSTSALRVDPVDIPISVTASAVNCGFEKTYTKILRYGSYTKYFAEVFAKEANILYSSATNKNGVSQLFKQSVSSGHFYTNFCDIFDFNNQTYTYKIIKYEKGTGSPYNQTEYITTYYFGDTDPRIEGLTTGTYYVSSGTYSSSNGNDNLVYSRCVKLNNLFKKYSDNRYITSVS